MIDVLYDVVLIKTSKVNFPREFKSSGISPKEYICAKHDVDSLIIEENINYYSYEPEKIKKIYEKVKDTLKNKAKLLDKIVTRREKIAEREQEIKDSIANAELDGTRNKSLKDSITNLKTEKLNSKKLEDSAINTNIKETTAKDSLK